MDFMGKTGAKIDFDNGNFSLAVVSRGLKKFSTLPSRQAALTVFPRGKEGHWPNPIQQVARGKDQEIKRSTGSQTTSSWFIKAAENTVLEPRCRQIVIGKLDTKKGKTYRQWFVWNPRLFPFKA
jgi:hypothetical protein